MNSEKEKLKIVFNEKELNGALIPEIIYDSDSIIQIDREELMRILKIENKIRLSEEMRKLYDLDEDMSSYALLDEYTIKMALMTAGYEPDKDDSLKAYHLATGRHINDTEIKELVVWLKYDKTRNGKLKIGDDIVTKDIKIYDFEGNCHMLEDVLLKDGVNIVVCGSFT